MLGTHGELNERIHDKKDPKSLLIKDTIIRCIPTPWLNAQTVAPAACVLGPVLPLAV